jgi:hypothetical protein
MRKISLTVLGLYFSLLSAFAQQSDPGKDTYKNTSLKLDEVNLVSGYYRQDGNHSSVTGGIGTQKLNDISNIIELKFIKWNAPGTNKHTIGFEAGIDHHTSASQAYVSKTGASKPTGTRIYPSLNWQMETGNKTTIGFGLGLSSEKNYHSHNASFQIGKTSKDENTEINFKAQVFIDQVTMYEPSEFAPVKTGTYSTYTTASGRVITSYSGASGKNIPGQSRNTFSGSLTLSRVVNKNLQVALISDGVFQHGLLSLPFHRVYFNYPTDSARIEKLPSTRYKIPLGLRANYFLGDKVILRTYYRYYTDSWGIRSQTASIETPFKLSPFVSIAPFYRYYTQTAAYYFAPYKAHVFSDQYYTSNYDLSGFKSQFFGFNFRYTPEKDKYIFDMIEFRYGHYVQTTGLHGDNIGVNITFK